jgi:hypothetical protein
VKAAQPEEAATGAFLQVLARPGIECSQLPKLMLAGRVRLDWNAL